MSSRNCLCRLCAFVVLLAASLAGCSGALSTVAPATIRFAYPNSDQAYYESLLQEFGAINSQITVELVPQVPGREDQSLEDLDVFVAPDSALEGLLEETLVLSLDPFIEQDESFDTSDFYPGVLENLSSGGRLWAIPVGLDPMVMYYNQDLFDQYGVSYPTVEWTWDDFLTIVLALRDPDAGVYGYAAALGSFDPLPFIYQHGGQLAGTLQDSTQVTFDDPLNIEALQWYVDLMYEREAVPTPEQAQRAFGTRDDFYVARGFLTGKLAMFAMLFSQRGGQAWQMEWPMRWGMVPLPRDARSATIAMVEGYFISAQAERPDACWRWITFLSQETPPRLVPPRKSLVESAAYEAAVGEATAAVVRAAVGSDVLLLPPSTMSGGVEQAYGILGQALDSAINGRATPEEALSEAQRQVESLAP